MSVASLHKSSVHTLAHSRSLPSQRGSAMSAQGGGLAKKTVEFMGSNKTIPNISQSNSSFPSLGKSAGAAPKKGFNTPLSTIPQEPDRPFGPFRFRPKSSHSSRAPLELPVKRPTSPERGTKSRNVTWSDNGAKTKGTEVGIRKPGIGPGNTAASVTVARINEFESVLKNLVSASPPATQEAAVAAGVSESKKPVTDAALDSEEGSSTGPSRTEIPHTTRKPHRFHHHHESEEGRPSSLVMIGSSPPSPGSLEHNTPRRSRPGPTATRCTSLRPSGLTRSSGVAEQIRVLQCTGAYGPGDSNKPLSEIEKHLENAFLARKPKGLILPGDVVISENTFQQIAFVDEKQEHRSILQSDENCPRSFAEVLILEPRSNLRRPSIVKSISIPLTESVPKPKTHMPLSTSSEPNREHNRTTQPNTRYSANSEWKRSTSWLTQPEPNTASFIGENNRWATNPFFDHENAVHKQRKQIQLLNTRRTREEHGEYNKIPTI